MSRVIALAAGLIVTGTAMLAAPPQLRPGEPTQGHLYIDNRRPEEAIPVTLITNGGAALPVTINANAPVIATMARQTWEYSSVTVRAGQDPVTVLAEAGRQGWETTGVQQPGANGSALLVLKRPR